MFLSYCHCSHFIKASCHFHKCFIWVIINGHYSIIIILIILVNHFSLQRLACNVCLLRRKSPAGGLWVVTMCAVRTESWRSSSSLQKQHRHLHLTYLCIVSHRAVDWCLFCKHRAEGSRLSLSHGADRSDHWGFVAEKQTAVGVREVLQESVKCTQKCQRQCWEIRHTHTPTHITRFEYHHKRADCTVLRTYVLMKYNAHAYSVCHGWFMIRVLRSADWRW